MKKFLCLLLCLTVMFSLFACGETSNSTDSATTETSGGTSSVTDPEGGSTTTSTSTNSTSAPAVTLPDDTVANKVIAIDQIAERLVIYDFDDYEKGDTLEDLEEWSLKIGHAAGVKYRENTVYGNVIIVGGSKSAIYEYPSGKVIWSTTNPGNNTHSVEILPSGNIVLANSTGSNLRFFMASDVLNNGTGQKYIDYPLKGAHGVLWDPEYEVVWALGDAELVAYRVVGTGTDQRLAKVDGMGCKLQGVSGSGHDLTADMTDTRYLYFTAGGVYRFDKEENEMKTSYSYSSSFQLGEVKGFGNNQNGKFFSTGVLGGDGKFFEGHWKEAWLTDTIIFYYRVANKGIVKMQKLAVVSECSAFYKVRPFIGQYQ